MINTITGSVFWRRICIVLILNGLLYQYCLAQTIWGGPYIGMTNYQGELQDGILNSKNIHLRVGISGLVDLTNRFSVKCELSKSNVSGSDSYSRVKDNRERNLSFESRLYEVSIIGRYYLNNSFVKFQPYLFGGFSMFRVNPYAFDNSGTRWYLYPLSTEGQGLPGYSDPNKLYHVAIPLGLGLKLHLSQDVIFDIDIGFRKTFTDYMDDVSNKYVDRQLLLNHRGTKSLEMAYRGNVNSGNTNNYPVAGSIRGNPGKMDSFVSCSLGLQVLLFEFRDHQKFKLRRSAMKSMRCPVL